MPQAEPTIRGFVDARAEPSATVASMEVLGVPLAVWSAAALTRVIPLERIVVATSSEPLRERLRPFAIGVVDEIDADLGVLAADPASPFHSDAALLEAARDAQTRSARIEAAKEDPIGGLRVECASDLPLIEAVALGLDPDDPRVAGVRAVGLRRLLARRGPIEAVITDVDGVLTDGSLALHSDGLESRDFFVRDGLGVGLLRKAGVKHALLSATLSGGSIERRAEMLGIEFVDHGEGDKGPRLEALCARMGAAPERCVYIGDDRNDAPALERAGVGVCPFDAHATARSAADWTLRSRGGRGAFREVVDALLRVLEERPLLNDPIRSRADEEDAGHV